MSLENLADNSILPRLALRLKFGHVSDLSSQYPSTLHQDSASSQPLFSLSAEIPAAISRQSCLPHAANSVLPLDLCRVTPRLQFAPIGLSFRPSGSERISHRRMSCQDLPVYRSVGSGDWRVLVSGRTRGVFILNTGSDFRRQAAPKVFRTNNLWLRSVRSIDQNAFHSVPSARRSERPTSWFRRVRHSI